MNKILKNKINFYLCIAFTLVIISISLILNYIKGPAEYSLYTEKFARDFKSVSISNKESLTMVEYLDEISKYNKNVYGNPIYSYINDGKSERETPIFPVWEEIPYFLKNRQVEGEQFSEKNTNKNVAIIGKGLKNSLYEKENKKYITIFLNQEKLEFEVIGVIQKDEYLSSFVVIPYKALTNAKVGGFKSDKYSFLIPVKAKLNEGDWKLKVDKIVEHNNKPYFKIIFDEFLDMISNIKNLIICTFLCVVNAIIFSIFWIKSIVRKISIFKILGANNWYIIKYIFIRMIFIGILGSILGGAFILILSKIIFIEHALSVWSVIVGMIATISVALISTIFSFVGVLKFNIIEYIR